MAEGLRGVQAAHVSSLIYSKAVDLVGGGQRSRHEVMAPAKPASFLLPVPVRVWSARDSGGRSVLQGTPTSSSFLLCELDQIT